PTPAPINPVVAKPVPIILDACNIFLLSYFYFQLRLPLYSKLYTVFRCRPHQRMLHTPHDLTCSFFMLHIYEHIIFIFFLYFFFYKWTIYPYLLCLFFFFCLFYF